MQDRNGRLCLRLLPQSFSTCRLSSDAVVPEWCQQGDFYCINRTSNELSLVCPAVAVPEGVPQEPGWRCLEVIGPLDFSLTGVLAGLATALAEAGISIFAISTYSTDYLLVREQAALAATQALGKASYSIVELAPDSPA